MLRKVFCRVLRHHNRVLLFFFFFFFGFNRLLISRTEGELTESPEPWRFGAEVLTALRDDRECLAESVAEI